MPKEPNDGELNKQFGLKVGRPFHIISGCGTRRYVDIVDGKRVVIKTPNGYDSQIWYFDQKTKTIVSQANKGKSMELENSGNGKNFQIWNTNSHWW